MTRVGARRVRASAARALVAGACAGVFACGGADAPKSLAPSGDTRALRDYAERPEARRRALEESLVRTDNGYAKLRLAKYDEAAWGSLPEWNPRTRAVRAADLGAPIPSVDDTWSALPADATPWDDGALRELGRRAFFEYPLQLAPYARDAIAKRTHGANGLWESDGRVGGLVWVELPGGEPEAALTCSTCHASLAGDALVAGRNNADLRMDQLSAASSGQEPPAWGPGRVDVTDDGADNPTAIPDLRPVRWQRNLHRAATLRNGLVALAVRTETLVITGLHQSVRPPRKIAAALAAYLWSLGADARARPASPEGERVFARECARCHGGEGASGDPIPLADVGTDPRVGASPDRGTGAYRVPSLRFVGDRERLFASGAVPDLRALLDPARTVPGHRYGTGLAGGERDALLAYLAAF